jgi:CubicO group peptidase (beta-lactamase class C family)
VNQPGSRWEYGINIDWAGQLVERATGMTLNDYFQKNIFQPLGLQNINMFPTDSMRKNLAWMNMRNPADGKVHPNLNGHIVRPQLIAKSDAERKQIFNAGGHGCFAKPSEYVQIISCLLNDGKHAKSGHQLLKPETVDEMFKNQIPEFPDFGRQVSGTLRL